ncbi:antitoxin of toxin-antitoxin stability system [Sphingomonas floccifaciens]|uniref:antitoxin of toxin-antitoxin stability system n=1 Tax=Sphingomonas floccifaciens TaxID=1844115 RepID=UPI0036D4080A
MSKAAVFTMKLEPALRDEFMAAAEQCHRPASQVVRELMREFVKRQQERQDHSDLLHRKVDAARRSVASGSGEPNDSVEARFAVRRSLVDRLA